MNAREQRAEVGSRRVREHLQWELFKKSQPLLIRLYGIRWRRLGTFITRNLSKLARCTAPRR